MNTKGDLPQKLVVQILMERFVQFLIIGGLGLITGLWATSFAFPDTLPWIGGIVLSILSVSSLISGIATGLNQ